MLISVLFSVVISSAAAPAVPAPAAPSIPSKLMVQPCDFDEAYQFSKVECQIELQNIGDKPITLSKLTATRPTDSLGPELVVVPAHGIAHLNAKVFLQNEEGLSRYYFRFETDEAGQKQRNAEVRGYVASVLDQTSPLISFGVVNADEDSPAQTLSLSSRAIPDFKITDVLGKPDYLNVSVGKDRRSVAAVIKKGGPLGPRQTDFIKLSVNTPEQSEVWIKLESDVRGDVVPASNPFPLGLMRTNSANEYMIRLSSRTGKNFKVGAVSVERIKANVTVEPCLPEATGCKMLRVLISNDQPTGQLGGVIRVELPDSSQLLPVLIWGMLLTPEVKVVDFNEEMQKAEASANESKVVKAPPIDIGSALKLAVQDAEEKAPPGNGPLIRWSATSEWLVYGYAIYRSETESGPFLRVNEHTIRTKSADGSGSKYQWRDNSAVSGKVYWYYIGLLNRDGSKTQLSSPQRILVK